MHVRNLGTLPKMLVMFAVFATVIVGCQIAGEMDLGGTPRIFGQEINSRVRIRWGDPAPLPPGSTQCGSFEVAGRTVLIFEDPNGQKWICTPGTAAPYNPITSMEGVGGQTGGTPTPNPGSPSAPRSPSAPGGPGQPQPIPVTGDEIEGAFERSENYQGSVQVFPIGTGAFSMDLDDNTASISFLLPGNGRNFKNPDHLPYAIDSWTTKMTRSGFLVHVAGTVDAVLGYAVEQGLERGVCNDSLIGEVHVALLPHLNIAVFTDGSGDTVPDEFKPIRPIVALP